MNLKVSFDGSDGWSSGDVSLATTVKKSKVGNKRIKDLSDEVWKVMIVFEQKRGPDLHPIHITKANMRDIEHEWKIYGSDQREYIKVCNNRHKTFDQRKREN